MNRTRTIVITFIISTLGLWAVLALTGCAAQKKTGLVILNSLQEARNVAIKTVKTIDLQKQVAFAKRFNAIAINNAHPDTEALKVKTIDIEFLEHTKNVEAAYNFLEAIGHACEAAKVSLLAGGNLALVLAPVIATAVDLEKGLRKLGVNTEFVKLITGGK